MRDIVLTLFVLGCVPMMIYRPFIGLLFWMWLGFMNPHRLTWGFAFDFPFVQIAAIATMLGMLANPEVRKLPRSSATALWILFMMWTTLTTIMALRPEAAWPAWWQFIKVQIMVLAMMLLLNSRDRIWLATVVIAASICFYGVKGGIFTIVTGGQNMVLGPRRSFISGNTEVAFAIVIVLPLLWWIRGQVTSSRVKLGLAVAFALCVVAVLGSYSRGGVLAVAAMLMFLWLRSRGKLVTATVGMTAILTGIALMPAKWFDRMSTIGGALDRSEEGRINAWWFAYHLANDRPLVGGGFHVFSAEMFARYAPDPEFYRDAHSIFFEVLGEHGYVGLLLFVLLGTCTVVHSWRMERLARASPDLDWARQLLRTCQVSLVGYVVGGLFLGLAYFDLPYAVMALSLATGSIVRDSIAVDSRQPAFSVPAFGSATARVDRPL